MLLGWWLNDSVLFLLVFQRSPLWDHRLARSDLDEGGGIELAHGHDELTQYFLGK